MVTKLELAVYCRGEVVELAAILIISISMVIAFHVHNNAHMYTVIINNDSNVIV